MIRKIKSYIKKLFVSQKHVICVKELSDIWDNEFDDWWDDL